MVVVGGGMTVSLGAQVPASQEILTQEAGAAGLAVPAARPGASCAQWDGAEQLATRTHAETRRRTGALPDLRTLGR